MITNERKREIIESINRYLSSNDSTEIDNIPSEELRNAYDLTGSIDSNARYKAALKAQVRKRNELENKSSNIKTRAVDYAMGIITGLILAGLTKWLFG